MKPMLTALSHQEEELIQILSPAVGVFESQIFPGTFLTSQNPLGTLKILHTDYQIHLPAGVSGIVQEVAGEVKGVEYRTPLLSLSKELTSFSLETEEIPEETRASEDGFFNIPSLMDGIFYRRPKPDSPSFVEVGTQIQPGDTLGLLEVMKTFYPLLYEIPGSPLRGEVMEILAEDGGEVKQGQVIMKIKKV